MANLQPHQPPDPSDYLRDGGTYLPEPRMPADLEWRYSAELAHGVVGNGRAQADTYISGAYVDGGGLLASQGGMWAERLGRLEAEASTPQSQARIAAINNAFAMLVCDEIRNLRRDK